MEDRRNLRIYARWAPVYDRVMRPVYGVARRKALELLELRAGERVLLVGVGSGLDLPLIPAGVQVTGIDISEAMLAKARQKAAGRQVDLQVMNAQALQFPDGCFEAVVLNLILSVVPDAAEAFREAWRVLRAGGRVVIFDKFLPEDGRLTLLRRALGSLFRAIGTDPNRRLSDILGGSAGLTVEREQPSLLKGQYRILLLRKGGGL